MQSNDIAAALAALTAVQNGQGGWGWRRGAPANTECTALAVLALNAWQNAVDDAAPHLRGGIAWLRTSQRADGSWPMSEQVPDSSWMTSVASFALARAAADGGHAERGARWLLANRSRGPTFLQRIIMRLSSAPPLVDQDPELLGWPWADGTSPWVEPTSWALLALKEVRSTLPQRPTRDRIEEAHRLLADRMCRGGGWNYGNKAVLGFDLSPYPDTTALALIALQDHRIEGVTEPSIAVLRQMLSGYRSSLVLALSILALQLYGHDITAERDDLRGRLPALVSNGEVRTTAFALLALDERQPHFRVTP
ncbi:MAG TPA: hypothetical protein VK912_02945 [Longimicrobiales bacterium]|nr:hypothetical protein [Longimicrobiales bacterium]